jgi:hypothetical protein
MTPDHHKDTQNPSESLQGASGKRRWAFLWEFAIGFLAGAVIFGGAFVALCAL